MKKLLFLSILFITILATSTTQAQDYKSAIGLRLGYPTSISYKHFISEKGAIEGVLGYRGYTYYNWLNLSGFYEHHNAIASVDRLSWYYGGGASIYKWSYDDDFYPNNDFNSLSFGLHGIIGLDYRFDFPLNLSVDWIPTVILGGEFLSGFGGSYGALSARYILGGK
ncbi:MAG: hypothetical protein HOP11_08285 [Saprospiraceae bacterium]|nr:hypothetical protein [Saprospiraceae bacterium]